MHCICLTERTHSNKWPSIIKLYQTEPIRERSLHSLNTIHIWLRPRKKPKWKLWIRLAKSILFVGFRRCTMFNNCPKIKWISNFNADLHQIRVSYYYWWQLLQYSLYKLKYKWNTGYTSLTSNYICSSEPTT